MNIKSELFYEDMLSAGTKKGKYSKVFPLNGYSKINGTNVILRVCSTLSDEKT